MRKSITERFWSKVEIRGADDCWLWQARLNFKGYGTFKWQGKMFQAHRVAYILTHGPIPERSLVCHSCDTPGCANPAHLWIGSNVDNMQDKLAKGRQHDTSGAKNANAKLTDSSIRDIRRLVAEGVKYKLIGQRYGITPDHVWRISAHRAWKHVA